MHCIVCGIIKLMWIVGMCLRSVDLTNFIYVTDVSMEYIGCITTYAYT